MGLSDSGGGEADILLAREAARAEGEIDLRFLIFCAFSDEDGDVIVHSDCQVVRDMEAGGLMLMSRPNPRCDNSCE